MKPLHAASIAFTLSLLALVTGCSSQAQSNLHIVSAKSGDLYQQALPVGVADVQDAGDTDVVVTCQTNGATADCPPVKHVMHVRVLWKQGHTIKSQNRDASQNAAFHWYVTPVGHTDEARAGNGLIEYHGTGLVRIDRSGDQVLVTIENARLTPTTVAGGMMMDGLGATTLTGTIVARQSRQETAVALGEVRAVLAAARANEAEAKLQVGP